MTSYREGYCKACGEYSQSISIDRLGLCSACAYSQSKRTIIKYMTDEEKRKEDAYIAEMKARNENQKSEYMRGFDAGRKAALRSKNSSGCACVFDENDTLIEVCKAHVDWKDI